MTHSCRDHIHDDYVEFNPQEETVKIRGECWKCHRLVVLLYDYTEMQDTQTGKVLEYAGGVQ